MSYKWIAVTDDWGQDRFVTLKSGPQQKSHVVMHGENLVETVFVGIDANHPAKN